MPKKTAFQFTVISGLLAFAFSAQAKDWPAPIKALEAKGIEILATFDAPGGLKGYAGMIEQRPLSIYLTADGKQAIVGPMIDAKGDDLSQEPLTRLVSKPMTDKVWKQLEASSWIAAGAKTAPRIVYTFTDPNCPYCNKFWNDAQPWVTTGKVQVRHVIVGILGPTSPGKAAALLSAPDPQAALAQHEQKHREGGVKPLAQIPPKVQAQLQANQSLMEQLGFAATPATLYKDTDGLMKSIQGAPSADKLHVVLGPR